MSNTAGHFQTTSWSLVVAARASPADLDSLLRLYWAPVYAYIRRTGRSREDSADLTQGFLTTVMLGRRILDRADPTRGRFRTFLQAALKNFLIDQHRAAPAIRPLTTSFLPSDDGALSIAEPGENEDATVAFDRQWAARILAITLERLEVECRCDGLEQHWRAFSANIVRPALSHCEPRPLVELAGEIGAASPEQVSSLLHTVKRRFKHTLRQVVSETIDAGVNVDDEISELKCVLGSPESGSSQRAAERA